MNFLPKMCSSHWDPIAKGRRRFSFRYLIYRYPRFRHSLRTWRRNLFWLMIFFVKYRCCVLWIWREWETYCWSLIMNFRFEFREKSLESHPPCVLGTLQFHLLPPQRRVARRRITYDVILLSSTSLPETHSTANFVHEKLYTKILFSSLGTQSSGKHTWILCYCFFFQKRILCGKQTVYIIQ